MPTIFPAAPIIKQGEEDDPAAGEVDLIEPERIDGSLRQWELVQWEAAKGPAHILLPVPPDQLGDLRAKPCLDRGVALGIIGQEIDCREFHGLQEGGLPLASAAGPESPPSCRLRRPGAREDPGAGPPRARSCNRRASQC